MVRGRRFASGVAAAAMLGMAATPAAFAHDSVIGGNPENGAVLQTFPTELVLEFSGEPKEGFNTFALSRVTDGAADVLFSGEPEVEGRFVSIDLPADLDTKPGEYRIGFQIISSDGHATKGMTTFTFDPDGTAHAQAAGATTVVHTDSATQTVDEESRDNMRLILLVIGVVAVAGAGLAAVSRHKRGDDNPNSGTGGTTAPRLDV
ncbi:copper resistance protein CopC [Corynebacterium sp. TA-R-1]|uniref:Copper resistance protein CopC n=1 Tax=Corynebacterium stercoris TaxID=2943490 RepID=A0ABT1G392_9CORY|nr:copper resistance CopC family protein [Corynebacterium stercoris]MCP1387197.1 copper resistance protein CopC [Corynebacterium stercoris]